MSDRQGIEIDYCPKCRGVWLDRGELDKLIERSTTDQASNPSTEPTYGQEAYSGDDDDYRRRGRKKKGFLGDIFDFD